MLAHRVAYYAYSVVVRNEPVGAYIEADPLGSHVLHVRALLHASVPVGVVVFAWLALLSAARPEVRRITYALALDAESPVVAPVGAAEHVAEDREVPWAEEGDLVHEHLRVGDEAGYVDGPRLHVNLLMVARARSRIAACQRRVRLYHVAGFEAAAPGTVEELVVAGAGGAPSSLLFGGTAHTADVGLHYVRAAGEWFRVGAVPHVLAVVVAALGLGLAILRKVVHLGPCKLTGAVPSPGEILRHIQIHIVVEIRILQQTERKSRNPQSRSPLGHRHQLVHINLAFPMVIAGSGSPFILQQRSDHFILILAVEIVPDIF